jgi:hypothetical protein
MKKILLLCIGSLIMTNCDVISTNVLDGPNNHIEYGE